MDFSNFGKWLTFDHLFGAACLCIGLLLCQQWISDIHFYRKNNWDFSKNSGLNYVYDNENDKKPSPNGKRVMFHFPMATTITILVGVAFIFK